MMLGSSYKKQFFSAEEHFQKQRRYKKHVMVLARALTVGTEAQ